MQSALHGYCTTLGHDAKPRGGGNEANGDGQEAGREAAEDGDEGEQEGEQEGDDEEVFQVET